MFQVPLDNEDLVLGYLLAKIVLFSTYTTNIYYHEIVSKYL
nr:translational initiation factor 1 [Euphorbia adenochlora]YP_010958708.1 translational initiation factor 1 [Euphorbia jolkinii]WNA17706.1 translational initiation factor 1 [Euphorbia adenochlora]WNA17791.1 translational initiation factor 1 [Euphorbia jolkinii]WNA17876.1 translational initiation factor 1 [Euphorbia jolkinii]WNA17961.1 translational initiation factor 1 [Euphorbia jolkinii]WNA18046.1 translational initiation factor 1 [Euphorbia jolkinii]